MSLAVSGAELGWRWHWVEPHRDEADLEVGLVLRSLKPSQLNAKLTMKSLA